MKQSTKLILDLVMGAVIPIIILKTLSEPLGAPVAYVCAALVPVGWIFIDLFFITRHFNFITGYIGLTAIVRGALAFWFVDGTLFAMKDSAAYIVAVLVFSALLLRKRPIVQYFMAQALNPDTAEKQASLEGLFRESATHKALLLGSVIVIVTNILAGLINFWLNLVIVLAPFGTNLFNEQVAHVNAITRVVLMLLDVIGLSTAVWVSYRALFRQLPSEEGKSQLESDFWELVQLKEALQRET